MTPARRLWIVWSVCALIAGAGAFVVVSPGQALLLVRHGGYAFMIGLVTAWAWVLIREIRAGHVKRLLPDWEGWRREGPALAGAALIGVVTATQLPDGFKVMYDEAVLMDTALTLHEEREVFSTDRAYWVNDHFQGIGGYLDKRPWLYPVLLATVHDLTGYRYGNAFALNAVIAVLLALACYLAGRALAGRSAGLIGAGLLGSMPLLIIQVNGGGFEGLNLLLVALLGLMLILAGRSPGRDTASLLLLTVILLAYCRYESIVFIAAAGGFVVWQAWRRAWPGIPGALWAAPFLMMPWAWQYRVVTARNFIWQLDYKPGAERVFGPEYLGPNLGHALAYFFDFSHTQPNNPLVALLGLVAAVVVGVRFFRKRPAGSSPDTGLRTDTPALTAWSAGLGLLLLVLLFYFWGQFTDIVTQRLCLPVFFLLLIPLWLWMRSWQGAGPRARRLGVIGLTVVTVAGWTFWTLPTLREGWATWEAFTTRMENAKHAVADRLGWDPEHSLVIDQAPSSWIIRRQPVIVYDRAARRTSALAFHQAAGTFQDGIYVWQTQKRRRGGDWFTVNEHQLPETYALEPVETVWVSPVIRARLSRLTDLGIGPEDNPFHQFWADQRGRTDAEAVYNAYREAWVLWLP
ncbi:MAG: hypothetical protein ACFE0O_00425 [Opitutales bacterium]